MRDDFSEPTRRVLAERAAYTCSNPDCRRNQLGPAPGNSSKSVNLGKAAHICAAASGGPRFDVNQTPEQRSSIDNGIFLCGVCADLVDKHNGAGHPAAILHDWKESHERWIKDRLNKGEIDTASFDGVVWQDIRTTVGTVGHAQTVNIIQNGITYSDAREIALDVYKANYLQLSDNAARVARQRAEELTDHFLKELKERNADAIASMESPGMLHALFSAQRDYARTGDKDLESLLVDILVDRAGTAERNIKQIVLDEALAIAPKLTAEQMDALTVSFLITRTQNHSVQSLEKFLGYLDSHVAPFVETLASNTSCYEHLDYTGCGAVTLIGGLKSIGQIYKQTYQGLFMKGFENDVWKERFPDRPDLLQWAVTNCLQDSSKLQINAINENTLSHFCEKYGVSNDDLDKLKQLFNFAPMTDIEVEDYITGVRPGLQKLFDAWKNSQISKMTLTTVGIAVAHANFRRRTGQQLELSMWVK
jgi:hypothetical protein